MTGTTPAFPREGPLYWAAVILLLGLLVAGCGGDSESNPPPTTPPGGGPVFPPVETVVPCPTTLASTPTLAIPSVTATPPAQTATTGTVPTETSTVPAPTASAAPPEPTAQPATQVPTWTAVVPPVASPPPGAPVIALTIDTDTIRGYVPQMLDVLDAYGIRASFGVTGAWASANPDLLLRMARAGHTLINHSWDHIDFTKAVTAERQAQVTRTESRIQELAGLSTKPYFRPPYGRTNAAVEADVATLGYWIVLWNVDPQGWRGYTAEAVTQHVLSHAFHGAVVLMHSTCAGDAGALAPVITGLSERGYRFVTIAELYPAN